MSDAIPRGHFAALQAFKIISFLPIALFAENLRAQSSLLSCICSSSSVTVPLTGCVKDVGRLWFLNFSELFGGFETGRDRVVSSLRNGNSFPLVNYGFLQLAQLLEEPSQDLVTPQSARPVTVRVTFVVPVRPLSASASTMAFWVRHGVNALHLTCHLVLALVLGIYGFYISSLLMSCLALLDILQAVLRHTTSAIFSQPHGLDGNPIAISQDAPIDTHIIARSENASHLDVLVGYSIQLHALTNIPIRPTRPRLVLWALRAIDFVLVIQAAALTCLSSGNLPLNQNIGSVIWLFCYLLTLFSACLLNSNSPGLFLENQPGRPITISTFSFSNRTAALIFISKLPVHQREQVGISWMDKFIPNNSRRNELLNKIYRSSLFSTEGEDDCDEEEIKQLAREVQTRLQESSFRLALNLFWRHVQRIHGD